MTFTLDVCRYYPEKMHLRTRIQLLPGYPVTRRSEPDILPYPSEVMTPKQWLLCLMLLLLQIILV